MQGRCRSSVGSAVVPCTDREGPACLCLCYWRGYRAGWEIYCLQGVFHASLNLNLESWWSFSGAILFNYILMHLHCLLLYKHPISTSRNFLCSIPLQKKTTEKQASFKQPIFNLLCESFSNTLVGGYGFVWRGGLSEVSPLVLLTAWCQFFSTASSSQLCRFLTKN